MKLVYTHPSHIIVSQARSALEMAGIKCSMRNEYASGALGELAPIDTWPELWVMRDRDYEMARALSSSCRPPRKKRIGNARSVALPVLPPLICAGIVPASVTPLLHRDGDFLRNHGGVMGHMGHVSQ